jgi:hypothetical protein
MFALIYNRCATAKCIVMYPSNRPIQNIALEVSGCPAKHPCGRQKNGLDSHTVGR